MHPDCNGMAGRTATCRDRAKVTTVNKKCSPIAFSILLNCSCPFPLFPAEADCPCFHIYERLVMSEYGYEQINHSPGNKLYRQLQKIAKRQASC